MSNGAAAGAAAAAAAAAEMLRQEEEEMTEYSRIKICGMAGSSRSSVRIPQRSRTPKCLSKPAKKKLRPDGFWSRNLTTRDFGSNVLSAPKIETLTCLLMPIGHNTGCPRMHSPALLSA